MSSHARLKISFRAKAGVDRKAVEPCGYVRLRRASKAKDHAGDQRKAIARAVAFESSVGRVRSES
jgi:hypothetical protein